MGTGSVCECKRSKSFCNWCEPQKTINVLSENNEKHERYIKRLEDGFRKIGDHSLLRSLK